MDASRSLGAAAVAADEGERNVRGSRQVVTKVKFGGALGG
jgi:hypothetical protein